MAMLGLGLVIAVWSVRPTDGFSLETLYPIRYVRFEGTLKHVDLDQLSGVLAPLWRGGYFAVDVEAVKRHAKALAWVDSLEVRRVWPDTLVLTVTEQQPIARWGMNELLNIRGDRFAPPQLQGFDSLPRLNGPAGREKHLLSVFGRLNERLAQHHLRIVALDISERRAWRMHLDCGVEVNLGRRQPRHQFERFMQILPVLGETKLCHLERLDMRYHNGFAIKVRPDFDVQFESVDPSAETPP